MYEITTPAGGLAHTVETKGAQSSETVEDWRSRAELSTLP